MNVDINASPGAVLWRGGEALMVPLRCVTQMACCPHGGDLMAWCNNRLKAGKGKIMDCKKYMFIDTFPHCLDFCRVSLLSVPRDAAWEDAGIG